MISRIFILKKCTGCPKTVIIKSTSFQQFTPVCYASSTRQFHLRDRIKNLLLFKVWSISLPLWVIHERRNVTLNIQICKLSSRKIWEQHSFKCLVLEPFLKDFSNYRIFNSKCLLSLRRMQSIKVSSRASRHLYSSAATLHPALLTQGPFIP